MQTIQQQFDTMLERGTIPVFEFEMSNGEFIVVDISICDNGVVFEFDNEGLPVYFSGNVERISDNTFVYQFDEYFDSLDYYLQEIHQEIIEGYIAANNLELKDEW